MWLTQQQVVGVAHSRLRQTLYRLVYVHSSNSTQQPESDTSSFTRQMQVGCAPHQPHSMATTTSRSGAVVDLYAAVAVPPLDYQLGGCWLSFWGGAIYRQFSGQF